LESIKLIPTNAIKINSENDRRVRKTVTVENDIHCVIVSGPNYITNTIVAV
jgi:hypothetical protein